jgi:hypothetical protein
MRTLLQLAALLVLLSFAAMGCSSNEQSCYSEDGAEFVGKVAESMDVNTYTYVRVECGGESLWAAGPTTAVSVGDELLIPTEMFMVDFHSESLSRTFERLYFVTELAAPHGHDGEGAHTHGGEGEDGEGMAGHGAPKVAQEGDFSGIEVPEGGMRVADVWAQRNELVGQEVIVRGRVTKYNSGIMGRNWIHLQDGTGSEVDGTHDLVITTDAGIAAGNVITVKGTVALDQDFGSGYTYALLVENASIE